MVVEFVVGVDGTIVGVALPPVDLPGAHHATKRSSSWCFWSLLYLHVHCGNRLGVTSFLEEIIQNMIQHFKAQWDPGQGGGGPKGSGGFLGEVPNPVR